MTLRTHWPPVLSAVLALPILLLAACGGAASVPAAASSAPAGQAARASAQPPASASRTPVKISYNTVAATDLPFLIAEEEGYFKEQGIDLTLVSMTPKVAIAALSKGEIDLMNSPSNSIEGRVNGFPFKIVWGSWDGAAWTIIGKKDIASVAQLRGKLVATNNPGTAPYAYLRAGLKKNGMSISDVQFVPEAGTSAVFASIVAGKVDAGVLSPPSEGLAQEQGFREIMFLGDLLALPSNGLATTSAYIAQHRPVLVGLIRGMLRAESWMKSHPDETEALIVKQLKTSPAVAKRTYARMAALLTNTGETSTEGIQQNLELLEEATGKKIDIAPQEFVDFGPLREARAQAS